MKSKAVKTPKTAPCKMRIQMKYCLTRFVIPIEASIATIPNIPVNKTIGTGTNVVKPTKFDINAPTKGAFAEDSFRDGNKLLLIEDDVIYKWYSIYS